MFVLVLQMILLGTFFTLQKIMLFVGNLILAAISLVRSRAFRLPVIVICLLLPKICCFVTIGLKIACTLVYNAHGTIRLPLDNAKILNYNLYDYKYDMIIIIMIIIIIEIKLAFKVEYNNTYISFDNNREAHW